MENKVDTKVCDLRHERIDEMLASHENRIEDNRKRLDRIETVSYKLEERLDGLIVQLGNLNNTMRWFIALLIGSFVGFFFYIVQQNIVR